MRERTLAVMTLYHTSTVICTHTIFFSPGFQTANEIVEQLIICWSAQYPPNNEFARVFVMGFQKKLDTEPVHSVTKGKLRPGSGRAVLLKNKADLSQQFADSASFCSLLKLSSYKRHKWYLYPPIMPHVLVTLCHFSLAKYILC